MGGVEGWGTYTKIPSIVWLLPFWPCVDTLGHSQRSSMRRCRGNQGREDRYASPFIENVERQKKSKKSLKTRFVYQTTYQQDRQGKLAFALSYQKKTIKMKKGVPQQSQTPNQDFVVFGTDASLCVQPQEELYEAAPSYVAKAISLEWRPPGSRYEI